MTVTRRKSPTKDDASKAKSAKSTDHENEFPHSALNKEQKLVEVDEVSWWPQILYVPVIPAIILSIRYGIFWVSPFIFFVIVGFTDYLITPSDEQNPKKTSTDPWGRPAFRYRWPLYWMVFAQVLALWFGAEVASDVWASGFGNYALFMWSMSLIFAIMFMAAHELTHKLLKFEYALGLFSLCLTNYMHFAIEHPKGHHAKVGTPDDPATARFGETVYQFIPRSMYGSYVSAWNIELRRLSVLGYSKWSWRNQMIWFTVLPTLPAYACYLIGGLGGLTFFYASGLIASMTFELINYVEHYGLTRAKLPNGKYEPVNMMTSWNSNTWLTNAFLLKLQRHSDHHVHALKDYNTLRHYGFTPQYPDGVGLAWMYLLALVPFHFFKVMNPRVEDVYRRSGRVPPTIENNYHN